MERQDWSPKAQHILIDKEVLELISNVCPALTCVTKIVDDRYYSLDISYPYTYITFGVREKQKLSGVDFNVIQKKTWEHFQNLNCDIKMKNPIDFLDHEYILRSTYLDLVGYERERAGIFLKPARLLQAMFPDMSSDQISVLAGKLADALRLNAIPNTRNVKVSESPSEVYTINSNNLSTCMAGKEPRRFKIYDDLKHTKIAYIVEGDHLMARALLHDNVKNLETGETFKMMDRIYCANADYQAVMAQYAIENGYHRKKYQGGGCHDYIDTANNEYRIEYCSIECDDLTSKYKEVPYIDTFGYYYDKGMYMLASESYIRLKGTELRSSSNLHNTDGSDDAEIITGIVKICYSCDTRLGRNDDFVEHGGHHYCDSCFNTEYYYCHECGDVERLDEHVLVSGDMLCHSCACRVSHLCPVCDERFMDYDMSFTSDNVLVCDTCFEHLPRCSGCGDILSTSDELDDDLCVECIDRESSSVVQVVDGEITGVSNQVGRV
jgi:hypothetical protein